MSEQTEIIYDDVEYGYSSTDEQLADSKISCESKKHGNKREQKQEKQEKQEQKQEKQEKQEQKQNKKKKIIQKINIEEENEISSFNNPCVNCEINRELLYLVRNLTDKLNNVENEIKELKKIIKKTNNTTIPPINKKNVMEWLNNYIVPTMTFDEFIDNIIVNMGHFEFLLEYKLSDTIQKIIQTNIIKNDETVYPLYANVEKSGKVYVFTEDETWEIISIKYLSKFVKQIENKLFQHCLEWKNRYSGKNNFNSELQERCQNAILKLTNISYTQDCMMNRVRYDLCVQLKNVCK
jgi:hypothetical protein